MKLPWQVWLVVGAGLFLMIPSSSPTVNRIADAIAYAEGYYSPGSRPARNNNPGDLSDDFGFPVLGYDGQFPIFATLADGWAALRLQVEKMLDGSSRYYNPSMTIREIAANYTATEQDAWAANVAERLGVSVETTLQELGG